MSNVRVEPSAEFAPRRQRASLAGPVDKTGVQWPLQPHLQTFVQDSQASRKGLAILHAETYCLTLIKNQRLRIIDLLKPAERHYPWAAFSNRCGENTTATQTFLSRILLWQLINCESVSVDTHLLGSCCVEWDVTVKPKPVLL